MPLEKGGFSVLKSIDRILTPLCQTIADAVSYELMEVRAESRTPGNLWKFAIVWSTGASVG